VWVSQVIHLGMLVGFALILWRDRLGALVTALATSAFFAQHRGAPLPVDRPAQPAADRQPRRRLVPAPATSPPGGLVPEGSST
jgi:hypothetical protein